MDRLTLAKKLAEEAGQRAKGAFGKEFEMHNKPDGSLVTAIDQECERIILEGVARYFPDDAIIAEESGSKAGASGYTWYIDPIDGTTNFGHRLPIFATSVAVADKEGLVAGAINLPMFGWLFSAARGKGALRNGEPIAGSRLENFSEALAVISFAGAVARAMGSEKRIAEMITMRPKVRVFASCVMQWAFIASGAADAFYSIGQWSWDHAAGILIALEAGVAISTFEGKQVSYDILLLPDQRLSLCASASGIHDEVVAMAKTLTL